MRSLDETFARLKSEGRKAFVPYITAGFPDPETFLAILKALAEEGADVIEIGIPFSDPLADGPTIQRSSELALSHGMVGEKLREVVAQACEESPIPVVLMTYVNPVMASGYDAFAEYCGKSGVAGLIVPDLPLQSSKPLADALAAQGIGLTYLGTPATRSARFRELANASKGYFYLVSVTGTTGERKAVSADLRKLVAMAKADNDVPVCIGFGISNREQARDAALQGDGIIVGSALIRAATEAHEAGEDPVEAVRMLARELRAGADATR